MDSCYTTSCSSDGDLDRLVATAGVALLAQVGTGGFSSVPEACDATIRLADRTPVDPKVQGFYDRGYTIYRKLYRDLRESFRAISAQVTS